MMVENNLTIIRYFFENLISLSQSDGTYEMYSIRLRFLAEVTIIAGVS